MTFGAGPDGSGQAKSNLGIPYYEIPVALRQLLGDAKEWIEHGAYPPDEIAIRFHHRLVQIHPFPNGNGRHARLMADLLVMSLGGDRFSWGSANLQGAGELRRAYITALQAADNHDIGPLLAFARYIGPDRESVAHHVHRHTVLRETTSVRNVHTAVGVTRFRSRRTGV